jgi:hypothetical protein
MDTVPVSSMWGSLDDEDLLSSDNEPQPLPPEHPPPPRQAPRRSAPPPPKKKQQQQQQHQSLLPGPSPPPVDPFTHSAMQIIQDKAGSIPRILRWAIGLSIVALILISVFLYAVHQKHDRLSIRVDDHITQHQQQQSVGKKSSPSPPHSQAPPPPRGNFPKEDDLFLVGSKLEKTFDVSSVGTFTLDWDDVIFRRLQRYEMCCTVNTSVFLCGDLFSASLSNLNDGTRLSMHIPPSTVARCHMDVFLQPEE